MTLRHYLNFLSIDEDGTYQEMSADADGILRSRVFPGLWLHANALLQLDGATVMDVLRQGLATPEHVAFSADALTATGLQATVEWPATGRRDRTRHCKSLLTLC